jgi:DNA-binding NtrC family response regulator
MAAVLLSGDLVGASRIEAAARQAGIEFRMVGSVDSAVAACAANPVILLIVDLTTPGIEVPALVGRIQDQSHGTPAIVAFGPHVHEASLAAARDAGCHEVLTRGQFMSQVDAIIARCAAAR